MVGKKKVDENKQPYNTVDILRAIAIARKAEGVLEKRIVDRELSEQEMGFIAFVMSAKRLKRERKKVRRSPLRSSFVFART